MRSRPEEIRPDVFDYEFELYCTDMRRYFATTLSGKSSIFLVVVSIISFLIISLLKPLVAYFPRSLLPLLVTGIFSFTSFITGLIAILKNGDRSIFVIIAIILAAVITALAGFFIAYILLLSSITF